MKIRIVGACGSGKSTAIKRLSAAYGIAGYELDNLIWDRSGPNRRFPQEIRDGLLKAVLDAESWILEGSQFKWAAESFQQADLVFILHPPVFVRDYRIIRRFVRSRIGVEPGNYKQSFSNLKKMIVEWNHGYKLSDILLATEKAARRYVVTDYQEILRHVEAYLAEKHARALA